jgi:hypothetical protein
VCKWHVESQSHRRSSLRFWLVRFPPA